jgi:hypothetical protein
MKTKFLLFFLILFIGCSVTKQSLNIFETIEKKEYAGTVYHSVIVEIPLDNFTLVDTELSSIPLKGKVRIADGTKCYYYYLNDKYGKEITMLVWDGATKGYLVK